MASEDHLQLLKQGAPYWNQWRRQDSRVQPDLREAKLYNANLSKFNLNGANLSRAHLNGANLSRAHLSGANLSKADLRNTYLNDADLRRVDLIRANVSNANLTDADLSEAYLNGANLMEADLSEANLRSAYLICVNLNGANLSGANLSKSDLSGADLSGADLSDTNLSQANLTKANLIRAYLRKTDLSGAVASETIFANADLREIRGLAEMIHLRPSCVALSSIQLPQDGSALHFLRGTGQSDEWIDAYRTMLMHPIQYHSLFISYSSKDEILARRLHADLQDKGVRCWFAPEDLKIGDKIRARIDEAIHLQDKLLLILSEDALESSWVEDEVEAAIEKEQRQQREMLFPVRLDESVMQTMQPWAAKLRRTRHIGDFTHWTEPQAYQTAFDRLLRDLKKSDEPQDQETKQ